MTGEPMRPGSMRLVARALALLAEAELLLESPHRDPDSDELNRLRDRVARASEELAKAFVGPRSGGAA